MPPPTTASATIIPTISPLLLFISSARPASQHKSEAGPVQMRGAGAACGRRRRGSGAGPPTCPRNALDSGFSRAHVVTDGMQHSDPAECRKEARMAMAEAIARNRREIVERWLARL